VAGPVAKGGRGPEVPRPCVLTTVWPHRSLHASRNHRQGLWGAEQGSRGSASAALGLIVCGHLPRPRHKVDARPVLRAGSVWEAFVGGQASLHNDGLEASPFQFKHEETWRKRRSSVRSSR
jgi:hypothetical protein